MPKGRPKGSKNKIQRGRYIKCPTCGGIFYIPYCRKNQRIHCSKKCYKHLSEKTKERISFSHLHPNPKNGRLRKWNGYIYIYKPKHPFAHNGYVKRATLIMEKIIGRYLKKGEIVHHKNEIKTDDRPENLQLLANNVEHRKTHRFSPLDYL